MGRLEGKSVVITGAGSGIGRAASLLFTKEGAKLMAVDKTEASKETVKLVQRRRRHRRRPMTADAGSEADVPAFIAKAVSTYGKLDVIWANAGISGGLVPLCDQTPEQWQEMLRVNLIGPFLAIKHAVPHMIKQGHGLDHLHRLGRRPEGQCRRASLQRQQGRRHQPRADLGLFAHRHRRARQRDLPRPDRDRHDKPTFERAASAAPKTRSASSIRCKRYGEPHEIAAMGLFLASDEASYVNGQAIPVDGGLTASMPYAGKPI